jgi:hypothetical protein
MEENITHVGYWLEETKDINSLEVWRVSETDLNPLTPNDPYRGRTAPLTSKVAFYTFIQQI